MGGIVVGVDGSAHALDALRFAIEESRYRNCPLLVVETWQLPDIAEEVGVDPYFLDEPARQRAADVLQAQVDKDRGRGTCRWSCGPGTRSRCSSSSDEPPTCWSSGHAAAEVSGIS